MNSLLIVIAIYLMCGVLWALFNVIKYKTFDMSGGFVPNWLVYPLGILFWWYSIYMWIKDRRF